MNAAAESCRRSPPKSNKTYLQKDYWDKRFQEEAEYDWFKGYEEFKNLMHQHVKREENILIVGCGNSGMTEAMYRDGYCSIVSTDISEVVVEKMQQKAASNGCEGEEQVFKWSWPLAKMLWIDHSGIEPGFQLLEIFLH